MVFGAAEEKTAATNEVTGKPTGAFIPGDGQMWAYATLGLGSALALFMYPHSITASLSSKSRKTIRRNAAFLPAYFFILGLLALLGWVAIAAGTKPIGLDGKPNPQLVIPQLFEDFFPDWFTGVAFAAIAIGAFVPAAIMSIAAANTFTRNIYKEFFRPNATDAEEAKVSKLSSLAVKAFALVFVLTLDKQNAINSSFSVASGSCRRSRRSCSASTRAGSTSPRCLLAGQSAWSTAPGARTQSSIRRRASTSVARSTRFRDSVSWATSP